MKFTRQDRLNSLLKEVISEVMHKDIHDPSFPSLITVTKVSVAKDLKHAKVYISVIGSKEEKEKAIKKLIKLRKKIGYIAARKVVMRYFPSLTFILDESLDNYFTIDKILKDIENDRGNSSSK